MSSCTFRATLSLIFQSGHISIRLACVALYYNVNIMNYVPLVLANWPVSTFPPPPDRLVLFSIMPVSAFLAPIFLFSVNYVVLSLLGIYAVVIPHPNVIAAKARAQLSTLLTHQSHLLDSVTGAGRPSCTSDLYWCPFCDAVIQWCCRAEFIASWDRFYAYAAKLLDLNPSNTNFYTKHIQVSLQCSSIAFVICRPLVCRACNSKSKFLGAASSSGSASCRLCQP
jgi:hypothetical protein